MTKQTFSLNLECNAKDLLEINKEIGQLKMVIGLILTKLPPEYRQSVIDELNEWGLPESAQEFNQFANPNSQKN